MFRLWRARTFGSDSESSNVRDREKPRPNFKYCDVIASKGVFDVSKHFLPAASSRREWNLAHLGAPTA